jgi:hypothetical protein
MAAKKSKGTKAAAKGPKKGRPTEAVVRKMVLEDPNTAKISKNLGVSLEEYVTQVVRFTLHPEDDPEVIYVSDEDLRSEGFTPPDNDALGHFIADGLKVIAASGATGFQKSQKKLVDMSDGLTPATSGSQSNAELQKALAKELRKGGRKG